MVVLHYAGISENKSSGVSVIVPEIVNAQSRILTVGLYNYGQSTFALIIIHFRHRLISQNLWCFIVHLD